jgi:hypothetical protein
LRTTVGPPAVLASRLRPSDAFNEEFFGASVAISGPTAVVGSLGNRAYLFAV